MEQPEQNVFLIGAKSLGAYGGYETFVNKLTQYHAEQPQLKYHVACKANGNGAMDISELPGVVLNEQQEFEFHHARCFLVKVPPIGSAEAIYYDVAALERCCQYIEAHQIAHPIVYIMACRIGPFIRHFYRRIHRLGGKIYLNPDGHEWKRTKWNRLIRAYWKYSERRMVRYCDLTVCDSVHIEEYIHQSYDGRGIGRADPKTTFIAYGAEVCQDRPQEQDRQRAEDWFAEHGLRAGEYYLSVGRFVPENSFEIMLREFMHSDTERDFAIITTENQKYYDKLKEKIHFSADHRIKFVGTVYDEALLKQIRQNAYAYIHGHTVGGTNPSLLEALGCTRLNLLTDVVFNREVAEDSALYWSAEPGSLAGLISRVDRFSPDEIEHFGRRAKERIMAAYTWAEICERYRQLFLRR